MGIVLATTLTAGAESPSVEITGPISGTTIYQSVKAPFYGMLPVFAVAKGLNSDSTTLEIFVDGNPTSSAMNSEKNGRNMRAFIPQVDVGPHTLVAKATDRSTGVPVIITSSPVRFIVVADPDGPIGLRCHVQRYYKTNGQPLWVNASVFLITDPQGTFVTGNLTEDQRAEIKCSLKPSSGSETHVKVRFRRNMTEPYTVLSEQFLPGDGTSFTEKVESKESGLFDYVVEARRPGGLEEQSPILKLRFIEPNELPTIVSPPDSSRFTSNRAIILNTNVQDDSHLDRVCIGRIVMGRGEGGLDPCVSKPPYQLQAQPNAFPQEWTYYLGVINIYGHSYSMGDPLFTNGVGIVSTRIVWSTQGTNPTVVNGFESPPSNQEFSVGDDIDIIPRITWASNRPTRVEIFNGSTLLGLAERDAVIDRWIFHWKPSLPGTYVITAMASVSNAVWAKSVPLLLRVASKPTVSIVEPIQGASYTTPGRIPVKVAAASDARRQVTQVEVMVNGNLIGSIIPPDHDFMWQSDLTPGPAKITAKVVDSRGSSSKSEEVMITLGPARVPSVIARIVAPLPGTMVDAEALEQFHYVVSSEPTEITKVEFLLDSVVIGAVETQGNSLDAKSRFPELALGPHTIKVQVHTSDNRFVTSDPVAFVASLIPKVRMVTPVEGAVFVEQTVIPLSINIANLDIPLTKVEFLSGTAVIAELSGKPYSYKWKPPGIGEYVLSAKVTDINGQSHISADLHIRVSTIALNVTSHAHGEVVYATSTVIAGEWSGPIQSVSINGETAKLTSRSFSALVNLLPGSNEITVTAWSDNHATETKTLQVILRDPEITLLSPSADSSTTDGFVTVTGTFTASPGAGIAVNGQIAAVKNNEFVMSTVMLEPGPNDIRVRLSLADGQVKEQTITVTRLPGAGISVYALHQEMYAPTRVDFGAFEPTTEEDLSCCFPPSELDHDHEPSRSIQYAYPGHYDALLNVTSGSGVKREFRIPVIIQDRSELDQHLRYHIRQMFNELRAGRIAEALKYFTVSSRDQYKRAFLSLGTELGRISDRLKEFLAGHLGQNFAEYIVSVDTRDGLQGSSIYFIKCEDGVWRIESL